MPEPGLAQLLHHPALARFFHAWDAKKEICLHSLPASAQAYLLAAWRLQHPELAMAVLAPSVRLQEEISNDLEAWKCEALVFPETGGLGPGAAQDPDLQAETQDALHALLDNSNRLLIATESAWERKLPPPGLFKKSLLAIRRGIALPMENFLQDLIRAGYQQEGMAGQRGQFSRRGGIMDVFSWNGQMPLRIEWFGDEIESIREFDPADQQSIRQLTSASVSLAVLEQDPESSVSLASYFQPVLIYLGAREASSVEALDFIEHGFLHENSQDPVLQENRRRLLSRQLGDWLDEDWEVWISSNNEGEEQRLREWLREQNLPGLEEGKARFHFCQSPLLRGFAWPSERLALLTDAEIFGRYQTLRSLRRTARAQAVRSRLAAVDFSDLQDGDNVVHVEHGIALYGGMQELPSAQGDAMQQVLVLQFAEGAKLYVPLEQAYLVSKYVGVGKRNPALDTLGGSRWERAKRQAERAVYDYAAELLKIQAERETLVGTAFPADTPWQNEFEAAFLYEETPDQIRSIAEVKQDMESRRPMDRLICGDVGFGKTEVAIRAAFKAATAGRQVAFLVPTTVLAQQHYETLGERLADYPVNIGLLSRFQSPAQQRRVVEQLASGGVDIVVGTHRLISRDVKFKNLGLVIIDEEQRFGVRQKEQFKRNFRLVDVLTLSATPIPRTLYLSLMGARDMSTIETAPRNRLPVETTICAYDERMIRAAIEREVRRGGQVYYLHNRVQTIDVVARRLAFLVPDARIDIGHGQMAEDELEDVMHRFVNAKTDVLVSTTIIESGIDIPNANTIIIDRADRFGLADLYQLRGRVGRGQNRAHAILLLPRDLQGGDAGKRVEAIRQYSQLGAGFKIAMRDLEIRGAGNLLGTAQSGHIVAVGFELYCRLLKKAVASLKGKAPESLPETRLHLDFLRVGGSEETADAFIPHSYMPEVRWRIAAYRELSELQRLEEWESLRVRWKDRFGRWPESVELLLFYNRARIQAALAKIASVETKEDKLMIFRNGDYVMVGGKFPRLSKTEIKARLQEIEKWILSLKN
ncbi:MAG: transcription-repair coupling factor [Methylacidiphilales bacterium]|nr:transcription-repair coupling factor [Candidatus Methylacidiphilales bacterium]